MDKILHKCKKCGNDSEKRIESSEIGNGTKTICCNCGGIIRKSFLCGNCSKPLSEGEIKKYNNLKEKILSAQMVCFDCKKR